MKTRRKYDQEFKQMAVELSHNREDISNLAEELDIKPNKPGEGFPWPWEP
jgi:transposase-like protein